MSDKTKVTQSQIKELFGVSPSTLKDWKNNPEHAKHNLGLYLSSLEYERTVLELKQIKDKLNTQ